jgi:hypothetical protein
MPSAGFESAIPAGEWLQTHALDRSATGIGKVADIHSQYVIIIAFMYTVVF